MAHGHRLRSFLIKKANLSAANETIKVRFSATEWDRCREHGPAEELAQFLLELPSCCDDQKVSVKIVFDGDAAIRTFDLNLLMYKLAAYKPDFVFK